jgi:pantetheine-phosphate adenylyltransferase
MEKIAVYPGTFDPITNGHISIIERGAMLFDHLIVLVAIRNEKDTLFSLEERTEMAKCAVKHLENVSVEPFKGLLAAYMKERQIKFVLRGLRAVSDFDYEIQMALINNELDAEISTVFLTAQKDYIFLSSTIIREIASYGGDVSMFVPDCVMNKIIKKIRSKNVDNG